MPRIARVVIPEAAHHITQRGVRGMDVFFSDADRRLYLRLLRDRADRYGVHVLAWCLMRNHIHLIAVPESAASLAKGIGETHKRYTRETNRRHGWRGYLFQGRFYSCPLAGPHAIAAIRYVLRNPVRAGIVDHPWEYPWSNARWLTGFVASDPVARPAPLLDEVDNWLSLLAADPAEASELRRHTRTGRPFGALP